MKKVYNWFVKLFVVSIILTTILYFLIPGEFINISQTENLFNISKSLLFVIILLPILVLFLVSQILGAGLDFFSKSMVNVVTNANNQEFSKFTLKLVSKMVGKEVSLENIQKIGIKLYDLYIIIALSIYLIFSLAFYTPVIGEFIKLNIANLLIFFILTIIIISQGILFVFAKIYLKEI